MKNTTAPARGMRDLLPAEVELRDHATGRLLEAYGRYGYRRVETPALEHIGLLTGSGGGENEKLVFKVMKRGEKLDLAGAAGPDDLVDYGLRYDLTVPLARFYAAHQAELPHPFRSVQIGPVWRAERPQKGRFRQFTQCDIDVLGDPTELAEIELIQATTDALADLGLTGLTVRLNDRRLLGALVTGCGFAPEAVPAVVIAVDKLDKVGLEGVGKELTGAGHPRELVDRLARALEETRGDDALGRMGDVVALDEDGLSAERSLVAIHEHVARRLPEGSRIVFDPTLARGMGYYTGAIFEVAIEGQPFAIAGGGRYDRMVGRIGGRDAPACGFSIGFERVLMVLEEKGTTPPRIVPQTAVLHDKALAIGVLLAAAEELRSAGHGVSTMPRRKNLSRQLEELRTQGFDRYVVLEEGRPPDVRSFAEA